RRKIVLAAAAGAAATSHALLAPFAPAATDTWIGGGGNGNWTTAANWNSTPPANAPPLAGDILQFGGTANLATSNDFAANTQFSGINFLSGAGAFTLGGNAVLLAGNINNASATAQAINLGLVLDGGTIGVSRSGGGVLSLSA